MDALSSQASTAGYQAVLIAALTLDRFLPMLTTAAGTIRPAQVLVIGAGVAGLQASATAKRLGAIVEAYDVRSVTRDQVKSVGGRFIETGAAPRAKAAMPASSRPRRSGKAAGRAEKHIAPRMR
jgi:NAD(P) transhydrogenase subunit alpha